MLLNKIIFVGGKGGVGKSSISSSLACHLSKEKKQTLLISTDPAHNLCDLFNLKTQNVITPIKSSLYVLEIDPYVEVQNYIQEVAKHTKTLVGAHSYEMIDQYYKSAASNGNTQESALFDRLISIITQDFDKWDHIIIDTAPTGHTLRLFTLAQNLNQWSKFLIQEQNKKQKLEGMLSEDIIGTTTSNPLLERLKARQAKYHHFQDILTHSSSIIFVLNPDLLSIQESKRAIEQLQESHIKLHALAINKIAPASQEDFFQNRHIIQQKYLEEINALFKDFNKWYIPLLDEDIRQEEQLLKLLNSIL